MSDWVFDEDIGNITVGLFYKAGIKGLHIKYDLKKGGIEDKDIIQVAKKTKSTLITASTKDFINLSNTAFNNTYGVFILNTDNPKDQVKLVKLAIEIGNFKTLKSRKEKKVYIKSTGFDILNTRTNKKESIVFPKKYEYKKS